MNDNPYATAVGVEVSDVVSRIVLSDGRELSPPQVWIPHLRDATLEQRRKWEAIGRGDGIH
jgi:hypothetical protein